MTKKKQDVINDVEDSKISPKEVYENYVKPLGMPKVYPDAAPTLPPAPIPGLINGRVVHYVLDQDKHRPGIITNVLDATDGTVNIVVFFDGPNDGRSTHSSSEVLAAVEYSEFNVVGTWHFIEKA
jgi:hypothetical protein